jgi:hypothetical protein
MRGRRDNEGFTAKCTFLTDIRPGHLRGALRRVDAFWYVALSRVRSRCTRLVPLLALFAAFSFVIMMFNALPGGTTGRGNRCRDRIVVLVGRRHAGHLHRAGHQALFFGDGGDRREATSTWR